MRAAKMRGAVLRHDTIVGLVRGASGALRGVALASGEIVEGDAVVIAMGPWSILAARWLPLPAVWGCKGHSLVFETGETIPAAALFLEYHEASGEILTPELLAEIELELSPLVRGRKVDLRTPRDLSRYFREEVVRTAEVQYEAG